MSFKNPKSTEGIDKHTGYSLDGKEILLTPRSGRPEKLHIKDGEWFPESVRMQAAAIYAVTKSVEATAQLCKIDPFHVRNALTQPWFQNIVARVIKDKNEELDAKITKALDTGLDLIQDRLENGEIYVDKKTKEPYRVPVSAKNAAVIADIIFDKRQLIRGEVTSRSEAVSSDQRLIALKEQFEKFSRAREIKGEVIHESISQAGKEATTRPNSQAIGQIPIEADWEVRESSGEQVNAEQISEASQDYGSSQSQFSFRVQDGDSYESSEGIQSGRQRPEDSQEKP